MVKFVGRRSAAALALVACLGLAACGGSSEISNADAIDTTTTTVGGTGSKTATGADATACRAALEGMAKASAGTFAGTDLDSSMKQLNDIAAAAPSNIKADLTIVVAAISEVAKALKEAGYDPSKTPTAADSAKLAAAMVSVGSKFADEKYVDASEHVSDWFEGGCKTS